MSDPVGQAADAAYEAGHEDGLLTALGVLRTSISLEHAIARLEEAASDE